MTDARVREGIFSIANRRAELDLSASAAATTQTTVPKRSAQVIKINPSASASELRQEDSVVIGKGTRFDGPILECGVLDVYGVVDANTVTARLIVREGGQVRGTIQAGDAIIAGACDGAVSVSGHLEVESTGRVQGDVSYRSIALEVGATVIGKIRHQDDNAAQPVKSGDHGSIFTS